MIPALRASIAILILAAATLVCIPVQWLALRLGWRLRETLPQAWHRLVLGLGGIKVTVHGRETTDRPLMIAANHISWIDIPVIASLTPVRFAVDMQSIRHPILRLFAHLQPCLFLEVDGPTMAESVGTTETPLVVFAEGTTGAGNSVLPFRPDLIGSGGAATAVPDRPLWVQPLSIAYTNVQGLPMGRQFRPVAAWTGHTRLLPHVWTVFREYSIDAVVSWGAPFQGDSDSHSVAGKTEESVRIMTANVLTGRDPT
ncbi:MAG: lysophospholipid acyltransferase family protein [Pseudomonadota bacterium]